MERRYPVPMKLPIIGEIKRIIGCVREDDTSGFDFFENDIFVLFDPNQPIECGCEDAGDDEPDMMDDGGSKQPTIKGSTEILDELRQDAIEEEIDDLEPDEEDFIRSITIGVTGTIFSSFSDPPPNSGNDTPAPMMFPVSGHDPDCIMSQPNFHHKPSNLKIWWMGDVMITNQQIKFKMFHNIINQCVGSLGRRTEEFLVRGLAFDGDYLDLDRTPLEEEDENDADMCEPEMP